MAGMEHMYTAPFSSGPLPQGSKLSTYLMNRAPPPADFPDLPSTLAGLNLERSAVKQPPPPAAAATAPVLPHSVSTPSFAAAAAVNGQPYSPVRGGARRLGAGDGTTVSQPDVPVFQPRQPVGSRQERVGGTTYFYTSEERAAALEPPPVVPPYTAYLPPPPQLPPPPPPAAARLPCAASVSVTAAPAPSAAAAADSFFVSDELREQVLRRQALLLEQPNPAAFPELPAEVESYHELCPLERDGPAQKSALFGCVTSCYKATSIKTGHCCLLRRLHGVRVQGTRWLQLAAMWRKVSHASLVALRDAFVTKAFGDTSLVVVYDYFPAAETLRSRHFSQLPQLNGFADPFQDPSIPRPYSAQKTAVARQKSALLPEAQVWDYVVQLTGVLRQVHTAGLACRVVEPTKILVAGQDRLLVNCCGIPDLLSADTTASASALTQSYQQEDLVSLGKLLLALSCNSVLAVQRENFNTSIHIVERHYSADLKTLIMSLLMSPSGGRQRNINDVMPLIGARFYSQLDGARRLCDRLEDELAREVQNGRLFRLMAKLSAITERPELNLDGAWAETGDRYLLKLFRDHVFHAVTEDGRPFLDMAHVVQSLNKLDAASPDKVCLMSRDMQNVLVTSYAELKQCYERSFQELFDASLAKEPPAA